METRIVLGNGQRLKDVCIGNKRRIMIQENGARVPILMKNVKYVPQLYCILFSISAALKEGCKAKNERSELMTVHRMLVQPSENITRSTCLKFGKHCEGCSLGKTKQKNINKIIVPRAKQVGERTFMDISSIKHKSAGEAKFWALFMDDCSGF